MGGASNGTGGPYPFNANTCYGAASTSKTQPLPPANLQATVN
jgi:hypothetical protein